MASGAGSFHDKALRVDSSLLLRLSLLLLLLRPFFASDRGFAIRLSGIETRMGSAISARFINFLSTL